MHKLVGNKQKYYQKLNLKLKEKFFARCEMSLRQKPNNSLSDFTFCISVFILYLSGLCIQLE